MAHRWHYMGDINLEYGGYFWREDGADDYVLCVRVTPCSDAGGPDNLYWIESGSIYMPDDVEKRQCALSIIGMENEAKPTREALVDAWLSYGHFDHDCRNGQIVVQIGKKQEMPRNFDPDIQADAVLRANASLKNYIRKNYLS